MSTEIFWYGLACVRPVGKRTREFRENAEAFVNVVSLATSEASFQENVRNAANVYGFNLLSIEDIKMAHVDESKNACCGEEVFELIEKSKNSGCVEFGTFFSYDPT